MSALQLFFAIALPLLVYLLFGFAATGAEDVSTTAVEVVVSSFKSGIWLAEVSIFWSLSIERLVVGGGGVAGI